MSSAEMAGHVAELEAALHDAKVAASASLAEAASLKKSASGEGVLPTKAAVGLGRPEAATGV